MKTKKLQEVAPFSRFIRHLATDIEHATSRPITHLVDFGAGQNYLGRALASAPINRHVIAVEGRRENVEGARRMDVTAKLAPKEGVLRNKKEWKARGKGKRSVKEGGEASDAAQQGPENRKAVDGNVDVSVVSGDPGANVGVELESKSNGSAKEKLNRAVPAQVETTLVLDKQTGRLLPAVLSKSPAGAGTGTGTIQHIEQRLDSGDLSAVVEQIVDADVLAAGDRVDLNISSGSDVKEAVGSNGVRDANHTDYKDGATGTNETRKVDGTNERDEVGITTDMTEKQSEAEPSVLAVSSLKKTDPNLMVISLHSCGNLSHHGLRSLVENKAVTATVIVGCCYNLVTERLTTPSYKLPGLRPEIESERKDRLLETAGDPLGFPMSRRLSTYPVRPTKRGIHLNITTRMMAVQAPSNWTPSECENFFTRHYYRCLLQRVFLDHGLTDLPDTCEEYLGYVAGDSSVGFSAASGGGPPGSAIVIGSLRKTAYVSFVAYARAALAKLMKDPTRGEAFTEKLGDVSDEMLEAYDARYLHKKKELSIVWTLMAYSAQLAEAIMVVDRWQWLREQDDVAECWVEPVFDYKKASPRNLAVIGIKKQR